MQTAQLEALEYSNNKTTSPRCLCRLAFKIAIRPMSPTPVLRTLDAACDIAGHVVIQCLIHHQHCEPAIRRGHIHVSACPARLFTLSSSRMRSAAKATVGTPSVKPRSRRLAYLHNTASEHFSAHSLQRTFNAQPRGHDVFTRDMRAHLRIANI